MVTIYKIKKNVIRDKKSYILTEFRGLSTDEKPTEWKDSLVENGSAFIEIDTGDVYMYSLATESWYEV